MKVQLLEMTFLLQMEQENVLVNQDILTMAWLSVKNVIFPATDA